jgi:S-DNA-T family DNA segregation ATPase FtsK/SpoIIIE
LDKPDLVAYFVSQIMADPKIEKVFHNANYDVKFLGKEQAQNVTCTWKMAKKLKKKSSDIKQLPNLKLKTLAEELCNFSDVDKSEQASDWGRRPLSEKQLQYAKMDTVYLAQVHLRLLELKTRLNQSQWIRFLILNPALSALPKSELPLSVPAYFIWGIAWVGR